MRVKVRGAALLTPVATCVRRVEWEFDGARSPSPAKNGHGATVDPALGSRGRVGTC